MHLFEHAYHIDTLLCCQACHFHSTKENFDEILQDGFLLRKEWILCPNEHPIVKRYCELCMDLGDVTLFEAFYRHRNAIKCGACEYPVKVYQTNLLEGDETLTEEELEVVQCSQCGETGIESQLVIPLDDSGMCVGSSCANCYATQIMYDQSLGAPPEEELEKIRNFGRATETEVVDRDNIKDIKPGDHIECSTHKYGLLSIEHHIFVSFVDLENQCMLAFERLSEGVRENVYYFKDLLTKYSICRKYIYENENSFEESIKMALTVVGKGRYNLFNKNCECFVRWLKTGVSESLQVKAAPGRILARLATVFSKLPALAVKTGVARQGARSALGALGSLGLSAAISAGVFAFERRGLKKQLKAGKISRENYEDKLIERGFEMGAAEVGACLGTVASVGLSVMGVGTLGSLGGAIIVGILGALILANVGSWIGKTIVKHRRKKKLSKEN